MLLERSSAPAHTAHHHHHIPWWLRILGIAILGLVVTGIVLLATHWPFCREAMTRALEEATSRPVEIGAFRSTYFPPGCVAENIRILHGNRKGKPLITIERLLVQGSLIGMFTSPKRLAQVTVAGMHLVLPPKDGHGGESSHVALNAGSGGKSLAISKIVADGALLEFLPSHPGGKTFRLVLDGLEIRDVGSNEPMRYRVRFKNTEPPGVIQSEGKFGPWNPDDAGATPVEGAFTYDDINLGVFRGIGGKGHGKGTFHGRLDHIQTEGSVEMASFHVSGSGSTVRVSVGFHAIVNGTNGDTYLEPAEGKFLRTDVIARGGVEGSPQEKGKTTTLALSIAGGRIEDVLRLFVADKTAPMSGALNMKAKFVWPPGPREFVRKIRMDIDFGIGHGKFASASTQDSINRIGESAQGESKKQENEDPRTLLSDLRGHVAFRDGVATFSDVSFTVPGADARIHGTFGLVDTRVDLHGIVRTKGHISDATSGVKALLLKAIMPFYKKKHDIVPFKITGTFDNASVSLD